MYFAPGTSGRTTTARFTVPQEITTSSSTAAAAAASDRSQVAPCLLSMRRLRFIIKALIVVRHWYRSAQPATGRSSRRAPHLKAWSTQACVVSKSSKEW